MMMFDFTECKIMQKAYGGANGTKISILYNSEIWMLKFPSTAKINPELSYTNSCISEYLGCHVFNMLGVPAQETLLGTYQKNGEKKIVVACKDFTTNGETLQDFISIKNQMIDSTGNGSGTELFSVLNAIDTQIFVDKEELSAFFWDMFIVDSLVGNFDRHNGNWGFLYDLKTNTNRIAPIYDCGSCLYPSADEKTMRMVLNNVDEMYARVYNWPSSALKINGSKVNYFDYISSLCNPDCNGALKRIYQRINMNEILQMVDSVECIDKLQKEFYKYMLQMRKKLILDYSYNKLMSYVIDKKNSPEHEMTM